jgi:hypothetical protein
LNQLQELLHTLGLDLGFHNHPKGLGLEFGRCHSSVGESWFVVAVSKESVAGAKKQEPQVNSFSLVPGE